jgi:phenylacetic acid degradation operon negative regulatory protein
MMGRPHAKSLVLDLLATMPPDASMPVAALVEAGALFGIPANNVRVAIVRLCERGQVVRDRRGRYRLGTRSRPIGRRIASWRDLDRRTRPWRGDWLGVQPRDATRAGARRRERALRLFGMAPLTRSLWIRPDNLATSLAELRGELRALGAPPGDLVFRITGLDEATERRARSLWDVVALQARIRASLDRLEHSARRLAELPVETAMVESFLVGGAALRDLVRDPLLPDAICPSAARNELVARMREYDRTGRLAWADLLRRHDVPYRRAPVDARQETTPARHAV